MQNNICLLMKIMKMSRNFIYTNNQYRTVNITSKYIPIDIFNQKVSLFVPLSMFKLSENYFILSENNSSP